MEQMNSVGWTALILVIVGALNWGLYGLGGFMGGRIDLVAAIFGGIPVVQNLIYLAVGLAGLYLIYEAAGKA